VSFSRAFVPLVSLSGLQIHHRAGGEPYVSGDCCSSYSSWCFHFMESPRAVACVAFISQLRMNLSSCAPVFLFFPGTFFLLFLVYLYFPFPGSRSPTSSHSTVGTVLVFLRRVYSCPPLSRCSFALFSPQPSPDRDPDRCSSACRVPGNPAWDLFPRTAEFSVVVSSFYSFCSCFRFPFYSRATSLDRADASRDNVDGVDLAVLPFTLPSRFSPLGTLVFGFGGGGGFFFFFFLVGVWCCVFGLLFFFT